MIIDCTIITNYKIVNHDENLGDRSKRWKGPAEYPQQTGESLKTPVRWRVEWEERVFEYEGIERSIIQQF